MKYRITITQEYYGNVEDYESDPNFMEKFNGDIAAYDKAMLLNGEICLDDLIVDLNEDNLKIEKIEE